MYNTQQWQSIAYTQGIIEYSSDNPYLILRVLLNTQQWQSIDYTLKGIIMNRVWTLDSDNLSLITYILGTILQYEHLFSGDWQLQCNKVLIQRL